MKSRHLPVLALVAGAATLLAGCASRSDFTLSTLDGKRMSLSEQKGKVVLLAFWAAG